MTFTDIFIKRPVLAIVVSCVLLLLGLRRLLRGWRLLGVGCRAQEAQPDDEPHLAKLAKWNFNFFHQFKNGLTCIHTCYSSIMNI